MSSTWYSTYMNVCVYIHVCMYTHLAHVCMYACVLYRTKIMNEALKAAVQDCQKPKVISTQHCGRDCQVNHWKEGGHRRECKCKCKKLREAAAAKTVPKSRYKQQKIDKLICKVRVMHSELDTCTNVRHALSGFVHTQHASTQGRIPTPPALNVVEQPGVFFREMVQQKDLFRRHDQCSQVHQTKTCTAQNASWIVDDGQGKIQPDNERIDGITARLKTTMFDNSKGGFAVQDSSLSHCI